MSKLIAQLKTRCEAVGASLDEYSDFVVLDAPHGYVWCANGQASLTIHFGNGRQTWIALALRTEEPSLKMGLRLATPDELADIRHNNDDDSITAPDGAAATLEF